MEGEGSDRMERAVGATAGQNPTYKGWLCDLRPVS